MIRVGREEIYHRVGMRGTEYTEESKSKDTAETLKPRRFAEKERIPPS
jgi:hypothetical protein